MNATSTAAAIYNAAANHGYGITVELQDALENALHTADEHGDRELFLNALEAAIAAVR